MSPQKPIKLEKPADWPTWISFVRTRAQIDNIWHLIDPNLEVRPACMTKPPEPSLNDDQGEFDAKSF